MPSLVAGGGSGLVLFMLGWKSLSVWKSGRKGASTPYTVASALLSLLLTAAMGKRYLVSHAVFPSGVVAGLSLAMFLFYVYNLVAGGNPLPSTKQE